jgi:dTDP-4-dehydrorhamnose reductase
MPRLLITGASGLLGSEIAVQAQHAGWEVHGTYHRRPLALAMHWHSLDLSDPAAPMALLRRVQPDAVIHTAYERHGPRMWAITARGAAGLAGASVETGAYLLHLSSDAIFDGTGSPYDEAAEPAPIFPYGAAKAAAELAVRSIAPDAAIVRTSLLVRRRPAHGLGDDPQSALALALASGAATGALFRDEYRCPIGVEDLARAVLELTARSHAGIINVAGPQAVDRHTLGCMIVAARRGAPATLPSASLADSGLRRPADVRLNTERAASLLRAPIRHIAGYLTHSTEPVS